MTSERDEKNITDAMLVSVGPRTLKPHLLTATLFALVVAVCSGRETKPDAMHPGNLLLATQKGHASGIAWMSGKSLGLEVARYPWPSQIVFLSELTASADFLNRPMPRMDHFESDTVPILEVGIGERPLILGCDEVLRQALRSGKPSVKTYLSGIFIERANKEAEQLEQ
jgi:hypothetical protein